MTLQKYYYQNDYQYLERLRQTGPQTFELIRHTADPRARWYPHEITVPEALSWVNGREQVTRIE